MQKSAKKSSPPLPATTPPNRARPITRVIDSPPIASLDVINTDAQTLADPDQTMIKSMVAGLQTHDHDRAVQIVSKHLAENQGNTALLNLLGTLYLQASDLPRAEANLNLAHRLAPDDALIINNLSCLYAKRSDFVRAETILIKTLATTQPAFPEFYYNLARAAFGRGDYASATSALTKAEQYGTRAEITILKVLISNLTQDGKYGLNDLLAAQQKFPNAPGLAYYIAAMMMIDNKVQESAFYAMAALNAAPNNIYFAMMYCSVAQHISFSKYDDHHATALLHALNANGANHSYLTRPWNTLMAHAPFWGPLLQNARAFNRTAAQAFIDAVQANSALLSPLIRQGLAKIFTRSAEWETILTAVRAAYLTLIDRGDRAMNETDRAFIALIAAQVNFTEYAYFVSPEEQAAINRLHTRLADTPDDSPADLLLILTCYNKITTYITENECKKYIDHPVLGSLIDTQVTTVRRERDIMAKLPTLTPINDAVSKLVEQMYMENPYPAWTATNYSGNPAYLQLAPNKKDRIQALVAGCGTGQHAVFVALGNHNIHVTAIDLSRRSLAYAKRQCDTFGIPNIDFAQADILELGSHKQRYDLIESAGVLHHLADPLKGLDILVSLLKPGGRMMIGLYSEIARAAIVAGRGVIAEQNLAPTPDAIRAFRHDVLSNPDTHPARGLIERGDFYNTSTCRDLVFHVQEHRFTLPQIKKILADRDLRFDFFNISPVTIADFRKKNPDKSAEFNLDAWDAYERENPKTFYNMYQFWVEKPA
jgi:2-polyprenyl-3-methyl-5-hydroxy-6-metoxy-1,4-benzoquinol methylase/Tfp pilus assembly protein PilF